MPEEGWSAQLKYRTKQNIRYFQLCRTFIVTVEMHQFLISVVYLSVSFQPLSLRTALSQVPELTHLQKEKLESQN